MIRLLFSILGFSYIICPYDLIPDFFVGLGWLDDIAVLFLLFYYLKRFRKGNVRDKSPINDGSGDNFEDYASGKWHNSVKEDSSQDFYEILGLKKNASQTEIKRAYKQLVNKYHPDKVAYLGDEFQALAEKRFKEIQLAYQELKAGK